MTWYPSLEQVLEANFRVVQATGGSHGVRDEECIRTVLELVQASHFGQEAYPTLAEKAAYLAFGLCQNHPFTDGNKRTAWVILRVFLTANRRRIRVRTAAAEEMMLRVASGVVELPEFTAWVRRRVRRSADSGSTQA